MLACCRGQVFRCGQCCVRGHGDECSVDMSCHWAKKWNTLLGTLSYARTTGKATVLLKILTNHLNLCTIHLKPPHPPHQQNASSSRSYPTTVWIPGLSIMVPSWTLVHETERQWGLKFLIFRKKLDGRDQNLSHQPFAQNSGALDHCASKCTVMRE